MKIFKTFGILALSAMIVPVFSSCSSDDDDEPGSANGSNASKAVIDFDGTYLTRLGDVDIEYDSKGRVVSLYRSWDWDEDEYAEIDYSKGKITMGDENGTITFTKEGYISEISVSWNDKEDGYTYTGSGKLKFSYSDGHLTKVHQTYSGTESGYGEKYKYDGTYDIALNWQNGNLTKFNIEGVENEDGDIDRWSESYVVSYGDEINAFKQFPAIILYEIDLGSMIETMGSVGMLGVGPKFLPSKMEERYSDGGANTNYFSFTLNDNESIYRENWGYTTFYYYYTDIDEVLGSYDRRGVKNFSGNDRKKSVRDMFVKKGSKRNRN